MVKKIHPSFCLPLFPLWNAHVFFCFSTPPPKQTEASRQESVDAEVEAEKMLQQVEVPWAFGSSAKQKFQIFDASWGNVLRWR